MQTENVHATARQMAQGGEQAAAALQSLSRAMQGLQSSWKGGSGEEFGLEAQDVLRRLNVQTDYLLELAARVEREATEWEQVDRQGIGAAVPGAAGPSANALPLVAVSSIASLFVGLPAWLTSFLNRFFPSEPIISPLPDEPRVIPSPVTPPTTPAETKSKLGELMEKAEKERQEKERLEKEKLEQEKLERERLEKEKQEAERKKQEEAAKPKYISQYPARADDGTYLVGQEKNDSCAIASTKMALQRAGIDSTESDLRTASHKLDGGYENTSKWGTNPSSLDDLVNTKYADKAVAEYKDPGSQTVSNLDAATNDGKGVVVSVKNTEWFGAANAHSVTVVDVTTVDGKQMVLVNDPWPPGEGKRLSIPADDFNRAWYGDAMYVSPKKQE
jgi:uncharacterized protein YukE